MKKRKSAEITPKVTSLSVLLVAPLEGSVEASLSPQRLAKIQKLEDTMRGLKRELNAFECVKCTGAYPEHGQQGIACYYCKWKSCQWCIDVNDGQCPQCEFKESNDDDDDDSGTEDY